MPLIKKPSDASAETRMMAPVDYPSSLLPKPWRSLYGLNPMAGEDAARWKTGVWSRERAAPQEASTSCERLTISRA